MSNNQGVWCSKCYGDHYTNDCPEPVASVEAKEKEISNSFHWCRFCSRVTSHVPKSGTCLNCGTIDQYVAEPKPTPSTPLKSFLLPRFVAAMNDIGRYGYEKYAGQSFQARAQAGDTSRSMDRTQPEAIRDHAAAHFQMHIDGTLHDHFGTRKHQLAAVAFNAMMEYYFAGLDSEGMEQLKSQPDSSSIPDEDEIWESHSELIETISCGMVGDETLMRRSEFNKAFDKILKSRDSSSISTEPESVEVDYLLGRCLPLLDTLAHYGNKEAKEVRAEIASLESIKALHADIIDQGRKVQIAASGESKYGAMSAGEYIEWVAKMLEDGR